MPCFYLIIGLYMVILGIPLGVAMESLDHWLPDNPAYLRRQAQIEWFIKADIVVMGLSFVALLIPHVLSHTAKLTLAGILVGSIFSIVLAVFAAAGIRAIRR